MISVLVRRTSGIWEVTTTIYAPKGLADELGDQVTMDVDKSSTNTEQVQTEAFERAKKVVDNLVAGRINMHLPAK